MVKRRLVLTLCESLKQSARKYVVLRRRKVSMQKKSLGPLILFLEGSFFYDLYGALQRSICFASLYITALFYNLNSVVLVEVTQQHCLETNSNLNTPIGLDQLPPKNFVLFFIMRNARKWSRLKGLLLHRKPRLTFKIS